MVMPGDNVDEIELIAPIAMAKDGVSQSCRSANGSSGTVSDVVDSWKSGSRAVPLHSALMFFSEGHYAA